ncbi:tRNA (adenosine(37)-N6)-dimethylallyltransferase MiaA [Methylophilus medardicus]|uniref:tRNA dimethylallyltransferase n=1 Tax=Methylophilus medardicus TaxID=2588534 RepID=A0A5B8CSC6_9PROT|nr:tRNA (adenosine(37)-N6)-dimethylallyltransferase MiaA [Methylophilus medardicus]QDC44214.1 tRNA (adenosine(37)-N6)-dimethylallyltransferase MiaA [Methylophilus medardicus]QDC49221.1 tRNA (adenosine(37)-N6)-dimethylallyltransferase MiaA [Methylophilus medardicus]QDC52926.1 tRNA (adenosine(37)-N6)-dimethylallyltransferase MiaA [Methylophilus medardicus]
MTTHTLPPAIFLMGPTASGKTAATIALNQRFPVDIISVDSALVYRGMDIGTAKPDAETLRQAPHHLIDLITPLEQYSAAQFAKDALALMHAATARGRVPVLVGGTMLYFNALQHGLSNLPEADSAIRAQIESEAALHGWPAMHAQLASIDPTVAANIHTTDSQRIERALEVYRISGKPMSVLRAQSEKTALPFHILKLALMPSERSVLHQRIAERFQLMLKQGFVDEVKHLLLTYPSLTADSPSMRCVGYRQAMQYLNGDIDLPTLGEHGVYATRQLAKRQLTWLRGMDDVHALDCLRPDWVDEASTLLQQHIQA